MADLSEPRLDRTKQLAVEQLIAGIVTGAKTVSLYRDGHPIIGQIRERVLALLRSALGRETTLVFDVRAKTLSVNEVELPDAPDVRTFAATLHTLGVGQVLFTDRLASEGIGELFRVLTWKADEKTSLSEIQRAVQQTRIDGLQLTFVLSFVVTGEQAQADQPPGRLSEEQVQAFVRAATLPDFLHLLLKQNEPLSGKAAEAVTTALDAGLHRELTLEKLAEAMPWDSYDPRIRRRFDDFAAAAPWRPRPRGAGARRAPAADRWHAARVVSGLAVLREPDAERLQDHGAHEKGASMDHALARLHELLEAPASERQPRFAAQAYLRLLLELGKDGDVPGLLRERAYWRGLAGRADLREPLALLETQLRDRLPGPVFAARVAERLAQPEAGEALDEFLGFLGAAVVPFLLEELRRAADKHARARLASAIAGVCRRGGSAALVAALRDEDYFLVSQVVGILGELAAPSSVRVLVPLLRHPHPRVRESCRRVLGRLGGDQARDALAASVLSASDAEEAKQAITALSLARAEGVGGKLLELYGGVLPYAARVHLVSAMARTPSEAVERALAGARRRTLWERLTGRKRELAAAAEAALAGIAAERSRDGAAG